MAMSIVDKTRAQMVLGPADYVLKTHLLCKPDHDPLLA